MARTFFVPLMAYLLAAHTVLIPVARAKTIEFAGLDRSLAVLCLTGNVDPSLQDENLPREHRHDFGCCLPGSRFVLDQPVAILSAIDPVIVPVRVEEPQVFVLPQGRAPPDITAPPTRSRAPPR